MNWAKKMAIKAAIKGKFKKNSKSFSLLSIYKVTVRRENIHPY